MQEVRRAGHCRLEDTGIGAYEYWGAKGVDTRMELLSDCCGAEVYED